MRALTSVKSPLLAGEAPTAAGAGGKAGLEAWIKAYTEEWWQIDRLHRQFMMQSERSMVGSLVVDTSAYFEVRAAVQRAYRDFADRQSAAWLAALERVGFSRNGLRRQRDFFVDWVAPAHKEKRKTAVILVDALRFELGQELVTILKDEDWKELSIAWMAAELPSVTAVGMNVLFTPAVTAEIRPIFSDRCLVRGMQVGQRAVTNADSRLSLLRESCGPSCSWCAVDELIGLDERAFSRLCRAEVLVAASREIDELGENGVQKYGLDVFSLSLGRIKQAALRLREGGYERILITADHGFLLGDEFVSSGTGRRLEAADRRYAVDEPRSGERLVAASFERLGYASMPDTARGTKAFVFERGTGYLTGASAGSFYHGGASLQEMVVPVLSLLSPKHLRQGTGAYRLRVEALGSRGAQHRIRICIESKEMFPDESVELRLVGEEGAVVSLRSLGSDPAVNGDLLRLTVGEAVEVEFELRGSAARSRIRAVPVRSDVELEGALTAVYFDTGQQGGATAAGLPAATSPGAEQGRAAGAPPDGAPGVPGGGASGAKTGQFDDSIPSEYHAALAHLKHHGSLTEKFLVNSLGGGPTGARKARRFALLVDDWKAILPFHIAVDSSAEGKLWKVSA
jgi:hypothetical protein